MLQAQQMLGYLFDGIRWNKIGKGEKGVTHMHITSPFASPNPGRIGNAVS